MVVDTGAVERPRLHRVSRWDEKFLNLPTIETPIGIARSTSIACFASPVAAFYNCKPCASVDFAIPFK